MPRPPHGPQEPLCDALNLMLNYGPLGLVRATSRGISSRGMRVDTGRVTLARNDQVEILVSIDDGDRVSLHRIAALVEESGMAETHLRFSYCPGETIQALEPFFATS